MRLTLPPRPRAAWLDAFWIVTALWTALAVGLAMPGSGAARAAGAAIAALAVWGGARLRPREARRLYELWARGTRLWARVTRRALLRLCHVVIVTVVGLAGSRLCLARPEGGASLWVPRQTLSTTTYGSQFEGVNGSWSGRPWTAATRWALQSGNAWAVVLVPFLVVVAALDADEQRRFPSGIYTLF